MSYSPTLGRWLEQDPESYIDGMNLYQYVSSSPVTLVDPTGTVGSTGGNFPGWNAPITGGYGRTLYPIPSVPPGKALVYVCQRKADVWGGTLGAFAGKQHEWIVIHYPDGSTYSAGLGNANGVPGAGNQTSGDLPGSQTYVKDHSSEPTNDARPYPDADAEKARKALQLNSPQGRWVPMKNDCNTFCQQVIVDASPKKPTPPRPPTPPRTPISLPPGGWYNK